MKKTAIGILMVFAMTTTAGCGMSEKVGQLKADFSQEVVGFEEAEVQGNELRIPTMEELQLEESPVSNELSTVENMEEPVVGIPTELVSVELFFASNGGDELVSVNRDIPKEEGIARATIETLIEGPDFESGLLPTIPAGTQLLDINVVEEDKLCIVDFSDDLVNQIGEKGFSEEVTIYSIANTLCQFPTIDQVEFRIEGQSIETLSGDMDLTETVAANAQIVQ